MIAVRFCQREHDLAEMTILDDGGRLIARHRLPEDRIDPAPRKGAFEDEWVHVKSKGRYIRHDLVLDIEEDVECYDYSSWQVGRPWLRSTVEWHEVTNGVPRFVPAGSELGMAAMEGN
jgi:hypothetical protein